MRYNSNVFKYRLICIGCGCKLYSSDKKDVIENKKFGIICYTCSNTIPDHIPEKQHTAYMKELWSRK